MRNPVARILIVSVVIGLAACLAWTPPAAAADRTFTLFGDDGAPGWGLDAGNITNPGPDLQVDLGDNVTLMLTGMDGTNLEWFLDYNGNGSYDAGEPISPTFDDNPAPVQWNFTADRAGTFTYRDQDLNDTMTGNITIRNVTGGFPSANLNSLMLALVLVGAFVAIIAVAAVLARQKQEKKA